MKQLLIPILCLALILSGCRANPNETTPNTDVTDVTAPISESTNATIAPTLPPVTVLPTEPSQFPQAPQLPLTAISMPIIKDAQFSTDGTLLCHFRYQSVSFLHADAAIAEAVVVDLRSRIDREYALSNEIRQQALASYGSGDSFSPFWLDVLCTPERLDTGILSLSGAVTAYTGGPHPDIKPLSVTYDLVTGQALSLTDLLDDACIMTDFCDLIIGQLKAQEDSAGLFFDYEDRITELFSSNELPQTWYLTGEGLVIYFMPYEIAPYASGTVSVSLPYSQLLGILSENYFPREDLAGSGDLSILPFRQAELSRYARFAELVLDSEGTPCLLTPSWTISNLRIEVGQWQEDGFHPVSTVFAADILYETDAVLLQYLPETGEGLRIQYQSGGQIYTRNLLLNDSGDPLLIDP